MTKDYSHKTNEYLALEGAAMLKNHTEYLREAFKMLDTVYHKTNNAAAEKAKHHLAIALSELILANQAADSIYETLDKSESKKNLVKV
jgi:hypothetical protein